MTFEAEGSEGWYVAAVAQLGERETEDLKVTGSIPVRGTLFIFTLEFN